MGVGDLRPRKEAAKGKEGRGGEGGRGEKRR